MELQSLDQLVPIAIIPPAFPPPRRFPFSGHHLPLPPAAKEIASRLPPFPSYLLHEQVPQQQGARPSRRFCGSHGAIPFFSATRRRSPLFNFVDEFKRQTRGKRGGKFRFLFSFRKGMLQMDRLIAEKSLKKKWSLVGLAAGSLRR